MIRESRSVVIVTGGAGFIGSEVVRQLAARGERVLIVDNLVNGTRANVEDVLSDSVSLLELDIRDLDALAPHLSRAHLVYHLACLGVRHSVHSPHENHDVNATATLRLLAACRERGVPRFVYVSSSEVYGTAKWAPITEDHPDVPVYRLRRLEAGRRMLRPRLPYDLRVSDGHRPAVQLLRSACAPRGRQRRGHPEVPAAVPRRASDDRVWRWHADP